jgi:hypothetical protein
VRAFLDDLRLAIRSLVRTPALLATLLLSIGVGIGSNVVVHGFAKGLTVGDGDTARIAEPLPFDERDAVQRLDGLLGIAAGLVLVIALGNVASLLIGRSAARAHETSMRLALGASRAQLTRRVLVESLAIAVVGAALGILVSAWMAAAIPALLYVEDAAQLQFAPDRAEIALIVAACSSVTIASGLAPALSIANATPAAVLRRESAGVSPVMARVRQALLIAQLGCCCALVISAGLIVERLKAAQKTTVAHRLGNAVLATVNAHPNVGLAYFAEIERVATSEWPQLDALAWTATLPGTRPTWRAYRAEPPGLEWRTVPLHAAVLTNEVLTQLSLPPLEGRLFGLADRGCHVAVANEQAAGVLFEANTVGRTVEDPSGQLVTIIGVVREKPTADTTDVPPKIFFRDSDAAPTQASPAMRPLFRLKAEATPLRKRDRVASAFRRKEFRAAAATALASIDLDTRIVSEAYFDAMGATLVAGQMTAARGQSACRVGVLNEQAAALYFGGNAVGGAIIDAEGERTEIIGVVRTPLVGAFERRIEPAIFLPMAQDWVPQMTVFLGAANLNDSMLAALRERLDAVKGRGRLPPTVKTLETYLGETALAPLRIATAIVGAFAVTAVLLSVIGLYGALAEATRRRSRELAIRVALGARRFDVLVLILGEGGRLAAAGSVAGIAGSLIVSERLIAATPGGAQSFWLAWLAGPLLLAVAVVIASVSPARRGAMVDPLVVLRDDL